MAMAVRRARMPGQRLRKGDNGNREEKEREAESGQG